MKSYEIRGKRYTVGDSKTGKLSVRQYELIQALLKESGTGVPINLDGENKVILAVGYFIGSLMETRSLSRFLALVLVAEGEQWSEESALASERIDTVSLMEEDVLGELVTDFFTTRVAFANALAGAFSAFMSQRVKSTPNSSSQGSPSSTTSQKPPGESSSPTGSESSPG